MIWRGVGSLRLRLSREGAAIPLPTPSRPSASAAPSSAANAGVRLLLAVAAPAPSGNQCAHPGRLVESHTATRHGNANPNCGGSHHGGVGVPRAQRTGAHRSGQPQDHPCTRPRTIPTRFPTCRLGRAGSEPLLLRGEFGCDGVRALASDTPCASRDASQEAARAPGQQVPSAAHTTPPYPGRCCR